jgi:hypothetical protein
MSKIVIVADGRSQQEINQKRGKLFKKLIRIILDHLGYNVENLSILHSGMEIDIEGSSKLSGVPLFAECKCYEIEVDAPKLQQFYGKYMGFWRKNPKSHGIFIALPGINGSAMGLYKDFYKTDKDITFNLLQEKEVIEFLIETKVIITPDSVLASIPDTLGKPGEWLIIYSELGLFYAVYIIPEGSAIPSRISIFNSSGKPITDKATLDQLFRLYPEFSSFEIVTININKKSLEVVENPDIEEIIEVKGSSSCFEYQFPASPPFFVGRDKALETVSSYVNAVVNKQTTSRGLLFEANSGWGKSSLILSSIKQLHDQGHFGIAIDSRTASTSQFILRAIDHSIAKFSNEFGVETGFETMTGFDGATHNLIKIGKELETNGKLFVIFFDQFENVFFLTDLLQRITAIYLKIFDAQTNIIFGFSWKTDLVGLTHEFPYKMRDIIANSSKIINLITFSGAETDLLIGKLATELHIKMRPDLKFLLQEFSQGYPWLLKKLCAHVKNQIENGTSQRDIATSLLFIEELFQEDKKGLSPEEEDTLLRIARLTPISIKELGEEFNPKIIDSLVDRRLLVKIGRKYDIYWDIFRDYLNTNRIPVKENYLIRTPIVTIYRSFKIIYEAGGTLSREEFRRRTGYHGKSFYNVFRDLRLLKIVTVSGDSIILSQHVVEDPTNIENSFIKFTGEKIKHNRIFRNLMEVIAEKEKVRLDEVASTLEAICPYIHASKKTWITYSKLIASWLDFVDLAYYDKESEQVTKLPPGKDIIRSRRPLMARGRSTIKFPPIQYSPIEKVADMFFQPTLEGKETPGSFLPKSTINKSMLAMEYLGWIERGHKFIRVTPELLLFIQSPSQRQEIFRESALKIDSFKVFIDMLSEYKGRGISTKDLSKEFTKRLNLSWSELTSSWQMKIMLDWARHAGLVTDKLVFRGKGKRRRRTNHIKPLNSW